MSHFESEWPEQWVPREKNEENGGKLGRRTFKVPKHDTKGKRRMLNHKGCLLVVKFAMHALVGMNKVTKRVPPTAPYNILPSEHKRVAVEGERA